MIETYISETSKGVPMMRGKCILCGTNMTRMMKKGTTQPTPQIPTPIPQTPDKKIDKLNEQIEELGKKKIERQKAKIFEVQSNQNRILKENNIEVVDKEKKKVVNKTYYNLFKYGIIVFLLLVVVIAYLGYEGKLGSESFLICKEQECNPSTNLTCGNTICEEQVCNSTCICPEFPSEIKIDIKNQT